MAQAVSTEQALDKRTRKAIRRRIGELVASRPGDRRERLWARSVADLERVSAQAVDDFGEPVGPDERRAVQRHLAEVMAWCDGALA